MVTQNSNLKTSLKMGNPNKKSAKKTDVPVVPIVPEVVATVLKPRKWQFVGACDKFKIGKLVVDPNTITDAEIDLFIKKYTRLADYFKLV